MPERIDANVCVVGAGYAGLTAARRLSQGARSVVVLEARDRVGGRIWTQHLSDGTPVDRGGAWLAPKHDAIFALAREVGASTYKTWVKGSHLLIDGDRTRRYTELIPKIEGQYRTQPFRIFAGHSLGGLFAVHTMLTRPDLFNAYIAVSPIPGADTPRG